MSYDSFHNTIDLSGEKLEVQNAKALHQEQLILEIFKANPDKKISPSQMQSIFNDKYQRQVPLTSIRRAMSNLTLRDNELVKTEHKVLGNYGLNEHTWQLRGVNAPYQHIYRKGNETAGDFATKIIAHSTNKLVQKDLFEWDID